MLSCLLWQADIRNDYDQYLFSHVHQWPAESSHNEQATNRAFKRHKNIMIDYPLILLGEQLHNTKEGVNDIKVLYMYGEQNIIWQKYQWREREISCKNIYRKFS